LGLCIKAASVCRPKSLHLAASSQSCNGLSILMLGRANVASISVLADLTGASYPPGDDATFVYDMTSYYISQNDDAARGATVGRGR
jgi:hypothetical protein